MDELENKIKKVKTSSKKGGIVMLLIAVILVIVGISQSNSDKESWENFDGMESGEYYQADVYYLVGPFAEYTSENGEVTENLYSAYTKDDIYILIKTGKDTELPILGEEVTEENIDSIEPVKVYGYSEKLDIELAGFLVDFWNGIYEEEYFSLTNYSEYFGYCYLDTKDQGGQISMVCYIVAVILVIVGIALLTNKKQSQNADNVLNKLENQRILDDFRNEYTKENIEEYKKLNVETTPNYLITYFPNFTVIPFSDITNAYNSNMVNGVYQLFNYIAIETKNNEKYYIAQKPLNQKNKQFEDLLEKVKSKIRQGGI